MVLQSGSPLLCPLPCYLSSSLPSFSLPSTRSKPLPPASSFITSRNYCTDFAAWVRAALWSCGAQRYVCVWAPGARVSDALQPTTTFLFITEAGGGSMCLFHYGDSCACACSFLFSYAQVLGLVRRGSVARFNPTCRKPHRLAPAVSLHEHCITLHLEMRSTPSPDPLP